MSLLNTKTGVTTPWHCCVGLMADGEWISAVSGDFKADPTMEIVYEDGRPSYFKQKQQVPQAPTDSDATANDQAVSKGLNGHVDPP